jgi:hypothetical protein
MDTPAEIKPEEKAIADACCRWFKGNNREKGSLYTFDEGHRPIYAYLSTLSDGFVLFEHIQGYLWPGFVEFNPGILCREWSPKLQAVFQGLPADIAYKGLSSLRSKPYVIKEVLGKMNGKMRNEVAPCLAKDEIEKFEKSCNSRSGGICVISSTELFTKYPFLKKCYAAESCVAFKRGPSFDNCILIQVADCYKHSFHLACSSQHSCDRVLPKIEAKQS